MKVMGTVCFSIRVLRFISFGDACHEMLQKQLQSIGVENLRAIRIGPNLFCKRSVLALIDNIVVIFVTHAAVGLEKFSTTFDSGHVDVKGVSRSR